MKRAYDSDLSLSTIRQEQLHHLSRGSEASRAPIWLPLIISTGLDTQVPTLLWFYRQTMFCSRQEEREHDGFQG